MLHILNAKPNTLAKCQLININMVITERRDTVSVFISGIYKLIDAIGCYVSL